MPTATYRGPKPRLRIGVTGTRLTRGVPTTVTHREAGLLDASDADVIVTGRADFTVLTVAELRRLCRAYGLPTDGVKDVLVDRLNNTAIDIEDEPSEV